MPKYTFDTDLDSNEIMAHIEEAYKAASGYAMASAANRIKTNAAKTLKSGLPLWNQGFKIDQVDSGFWVISLTGKLANMMEDGIEVDEIRKMILNGSRAKYNRSEGKNYVDVPIKQGTNASRSSLPNIDIKKFRNADEMKQAIKMSDKQGGVNKVNKLLKRVDNVIASRDEGSKKTSFLTIRRISPKGKPFPASPFRGARAMDDIDRELEIAFERGLRRFL